MSGIKKINRRQFLAISAGVLTTAAAAACKGPTPTAAPATQPPAAATAAPAAPAATAAPAAGGGAAAAVPAGPILTTKPGDEGTRPVQIKVYNTPAEATGGGATVSTYHEAPEVADLVKAGKLPPVAQRLPTNPIVVKPEEAIGKYGGQLRMAIVGQTTLTNEVTDWWTCESLVNPLPNDAGTMIPNLAESWKLSDDAKTLTLNLRKGVKWSDGTPYTTQDIAFWWNDVVLNKDLTPAPSTLLTRGGTLADFKVIDDFTFQLTFAQPYALIVVYLGSWGFPRETLGRYQKKYLSQFHPTYGDKAKIDAAMSAGGFKTWSDFFGDKAVNTNPDLPTLGAWLPTARPPNPVEVHVRNPYYWKVDTAGNQLPYIGEIRSTRAAAADAALLKRIAGELDFERLGELGGTASLSVLSDNKQKGNYHFAFADWMPNALCNIMFNLTTKDPVRNKLYNTKEFRQALSMAIDRQDVIKLIYKGGVFASQIAPMRGEPYHGESDLFMQFTQLDIAKANQMLDALGLTAKGSNGMRLGPDGKEMTLNIAANTDWPAESPQVMDLVRGYWAKVGINVTVTPQAGALWNTQHTAGQHDLSTRGAHFGGGPVQPTLNLNTFFLSGAQAAPDWALWLDTGGKQGVEPPAEVKQIRAIREQVLGEPDAKKRLDLINQVFKLQMDNIWQIGIVVDDPKYGQLTTVHNRLRNVVTWSVSGEWWPELPAQWFINE